MRACIQISTGRLIQAMSGSESQDETLRNSAISRGYDAADLSFSEKTDDEVRALVGDYNSQFAPPSAPTIADIIAVLPQETKDALAAKGFQVEAIDK